MKLIIDISEDMYNDSNILMVKDLSELKKIIANGTPLPKGHGRLIDADAYRKEMMNSREFNFFKILDMQSTIIEADKKV